MFNLARFTNLFSVIVLLLKSIMIQSKWWTGEQILILLHILTIYWEMLWSFSILALLHLLIHQVLYLTSVNVLLIVHLHLFIFNLLIFKREPSLHAKIMSLIDYLLNSLFLLFDLLHFNDLLWDHSNLQTLILAPWFEEATLCLLSLLILKMSWIDSHLVEVTLSFLGLLVLLLYRVLHSLHTLVIVLIETNYGSLNISYLNVIFSFFRLMLGIIRSLKSNHCRLIVLNCWWLWKTLSLSMWVIWLLLYIMHELRRKGLLMGKTINLVIGKPFWRF